MIIRRSLAVILGVWFLVALAAAMLVWRVHATLLDPGYVKAQIVQADLYNFLYDDVLPVVFEDALGNANETLGNDLAGIEFKPKEDAAVIVALVRDILPPEELQVRTEHVLDQVLPYAIGETDEFEIRPALSERMRAVPDALAVRMRELRFGDRVVDGILAPRLADALEAIDTGDLNLSISRARARKIAREIAPGDWIEAQIVDAAREITAWMTRGQDSFAIRVRYADRIPIATKAVKEVLGDANVEDYLFDTVIFPQVSRQVGRITALSHEVTITDDEVNAAIEKVAPREWVRAQISAVIDSLSAYLTGESDTLSYTVDLRERRDRAVSVLGDLAEQKLREIVASREVCTSNRESVRAAQQVAAGSLPGCIAPQINTDFVVSLFAQVLRAEARARIGANIPGRVTFGTDDLKDLAGAGAIDQIEEARRFIREGFVFTDADLLRELKASDNSFDPADVEFLRDVFSEGGLLTATDLIARYEDVAGADAGFDDTRRTIGRWVGRWWLVFLLPLVFLVPIAFLGGRSWRGRAAWAAATVGVSALAIWIIAGPLFDNYARPELRDALAQAVDDSETVFKPLVADAGNRALLLFDSWVSDFAAVARNLFVAALAAYALLLASMRYLRRNGTARAAPAAVAPDAQKRAALDRAYRSAVEDEQATRLPESPDVPDADDRPDEEEGPLRTFRA